MIPVIYLDNAATTMPKPKTVARAVTTAIERFGNPGRSGHQASLEGGMAIYECRQELSALLHVKDPFRMVFCLNCTDALNQAIKGMLPDGGHVVTTALEHNSVLRPLHALKERQLIELSIIAPRADGYIYAEDISGAINGQTKLVVVTQASNVTGAVQPVEEIAKACYKLGVPLLVDGAQSAGCMPIDLTAAGFDLFAFPGHKGLLGPQGSGGLYIKESCAPLPLREGGTGSSSSLMSQPMDMPDRYESGTAGTPAITGLLAGTNYVRQNLNAIMATEKKLTEELWDGLKKIDGVTIYGPQPSQPRLGVITFNIGDLDASAAADKLSGQYGIACRAGLHCAPLVHQWMGTGSRGAIRFSVGPFNTSEEIRSAVKAVYKIQKDGL
jgi:cysteine desulfurase / selenocysteine lyase